MRSLIHKALIYAPSGFLTLIVAAAGVWDGLRDKIAAAFADIVTATQHPVLAIGIVAFFVAYVVAIFWTSDGSTVAAEARAKAKAENARQKRFLVTVGRSLANGFRRSVDDRTLLEFMQADGGYTRIRSHFSKDFAARLLVPGEGREAMASALLDEMDRLERHWKLV